MGKKIKTAILIFSIALNAGFVTTWAVYALPTHFGHTGPKADSNAESCVSCTLHRQLGMSEEQWQQIKPRLAEFKTSCQAICRQVNQVCKEIIDLLAAPQTDFEAIRAKQDEILAGQRRMTELVISQLLAEKQLLTPQQQKSLFDILRQQNAAVSGSSVMDITPCNIQQVGLERGGDSSCSERR